MLFYNVTTPWLTKMVNSKQLTIQFYVRDLKFSHIEQSVLEDLVKELNDVFRMSKKEFAETNSDIHEYLGLTIGFSGMYNPNDPDKKQQVVVTMYDYIEDIIDSAPHMGGAALDPARSNLFTIHKTSPRLGTA